MIGLDLSFQKGTPSRNLAGQYMFSTREEGEVAQGGGSRTYPHQLPTKAFSNQYSPCETSHFQLHTCDQGGLRIQRGRLCQWVGKSGGS